MRKLISILLVVTVALMTTTGVAVADVADDRVTAIQDGDDMDGDDDDMDGESEDDDMDGDDGADMDGENEDDDMDGDNMDDDDGPLPVSTGVAGALALFFLGIVGAAAVRFR